MKAKSVVKLLLSLVIIAVLVVVTITGMQFGTYTMSPVASNIKLGLDIAGGSYVEFQAVNEDGSNADPSSEDADTIIAILRQRVSNQGYTEAVVTNMDNGRFRVELPDVEDANKASEILGQVAKLTFNRPDGSEVLDGKDIKEAKYEWGQNENGSYEHRVALDFTADGSKKFAEATSSLVGQQISINLDGELVSAPVVQTAITDGKAIITVGNEEDAAEYAKNLANLIASGQLPYGLSEVGVGTISATLGQNAFNNSLLAGIIVLILIAIFMVVLYRLPGVVAAIALAIYAILTILVMGLFGVNLTLPGIAGVVLSLGMAVDANVIIFERIKEEMKNGKTLRASVDAGFHRAITAVIDANITTLISAAVLWWLGTGTVKGFAITLFIGVVVSMFTAIFVTKFILKQLIDFNIKNRKLYVGGVK